jgi:hypothetical protein
MTLRWTEEAKNPVLPTTWVEEDGGVYCLSCRRDRAGDEAIDNLPSDTPASDRAKARSQGRLDFEIRRDPERPDNRIAKACRTSTPAVRRARTRLGLHAAPRD